MRRPKSISGPPVADNQILPHARIKQVSGIVAWLVVLTIENGSLNGYTRLWNFEPSRHMQLIFVMLSRRRKNAAKENALLPPPDDPSMRKNSSRILRHCQDFFDMLEFEV